MSTFILHKTGRHAYDVHRPEGVVVGRIWKEKDSIVWSYEYLVEGIPKASHMSFPDAFAEFEEKFPL